jgi:hypothetical protein
LTSAPHSSSVSQTWSRIAGWAYIACFVLNTLQIAVGLSLQSPEERLPLPRLTFISLLFSAMTLLAFWVGRLMLRGRCLGVGLVILLFLSMGWIMAISIVAPGGITLPWQLLTVQAVEITWLPVAITLVFIAWVKQLARKVPERRRNGDEERSG